MIEGLKPYPDYRPSPVLGLGSIPAHWTTPRLKTLFREIDRRSGTGQEPLLSLRMQQGLVDHHEVGGKPIPPTSLTHYKLAAPGELVMNRMRAAAGLFGVPPKRGLVSPDYAVLRPRTSVQLEYFLHLFRAPVMMSAFRLESRGLGTGESGFLRLYTERFGMLAAPLPPLEEQAAIVRFIGYVDRRIRRYIRAKQKLIKLLEEQKQAIIHQAVTRGLDLSVPMRESHVPALSMVPRTWSLRRMWTLAKVRKERNPGDLGLLSVFLDRGVIPYIEGGGQVHAPSLDLSSYQVVRAGDFVLNNQQAWRGSVGVSTHHGIISPAYIVLA